MTNANAICDKLRSLLALVVVFGAFSHASPLHAQTKDRSDAPQLRVSVAPHAQPDDMQGSGRLLIHDMPSTGGGTTRASTLLFVPTGTPPSGGWPVIAWAHGTTTPGQKTCAPSLSPNLDGGLTRDGLVSNYAYQLTELVNSGYAVVAPDLEGLGPVATVPNPYFNVASIARALIAGVQAAHQVDSTLSTRWGAFGHSEGGHGVLGVEAHAAEATGLTFLGTVASAPYNSIAATAVLSGQQADMTKTASAAVAARMGQNFQVALMTVGLMAQSPSFDPRTVMGEDLRRVLPAFDAQCSVGAIAVITKAIQPKGQSQFAGIKPAWDKAPGMEEFLTKNDLAIMPGFTLRLPTLIVQGTADTFVPEPLTTAFVARLLARGATVTYKRYPGADHFSLIKLADADVLAFLQTLFQASSPTE